jgi:hypothetical protein
MEPESTSPMGAAGDGGRAGGPRDEPASLAQSPGTTPGGVLSPPGELSTDELIAASEVLADRTAGVFDRLAGITSSIVEDGIGVTVNLDGRLTGLELTDAALRLGPVRLAAEIFRLTQLASASAVADGLAVLEPVAGPELVELLAPPPAPQLSLVDSAEDFSAIESWAV